MKQADIGVVGLSVIGGNLIRNLESRGISVAVYNRSQEKLDQYLRLHGEGKEIIGASSLKEFASALRRPRRILLMIAPGSPVDEVLDLLVPELEAGDIVMDGAGSHFRDSIRRAAFLKEKGIGFLDLGVAGGEKGALKGASLMAGGDPAVWEQVRPLLESVSRKTVAGVCCSLTGPAGCGHFLKMMHDGIGYSFMQLIAEVYLIMRELLHMRPDDMSRYFREWNKGDLNGYLVDAAANILVSRDPRSSGPLIDRISARDQQKGSGKWSVSTAMELNVPAMTIAESVLSRMFSDYVAERDCASKVLPGPPVRDMMHDRPQFLNHLRSALYAAEICAYAQGVRIVRDATIRFGWRFDFARITELWNGGSILRARVLDQIADAYRENPDEKFLMMTPFFRARLANAQNAWRDVVTRTIHSGIAIPALASSISYYDSLRAKSNPVNMIQAFRDYSDAGSFERTDSPEGEYVHAEWNGSSDESI